MGKEKEEKVLIDKDEYDRFLAMEKVYKELMEENEKHIIKERFKWKDLIG